MNYLAALLPLMLAACAQPAGMSWWQPVQRNACPPQVVQQAQWVHNNVTRLQLAGSRQQAVAVLGLPAQVESFLLADNSAIDVMFYHTPDTACRPAAKAGLLPLVFQNDRLLGYGHGYYHAMVVPQLAQPLALPLNRSLPQGPAALSPATGSGAVGRGQPLY